MADIGDFVEFIIDLPERNLRAGTRGTLVHEYGEGVYEVEVSDADGETLDLFAAPERQFIVLWEASSRRWSSFADQVAALIRRLPEDAGREVLDFARFLALRNTAMAGQGRPPEANRQGTSQS